MQVHPEGEIQRMKPEDETTYEQRNDNKMIMKQKYKHGGNTEGVPEVEGTEGPTGKSSYITPCKGRRMNATLYTPPPILVDSDQSLRF